MVRSYEPKNGNYAQLIEDLDKQALDELLKEQQAAVKEHQRHSQQVPESFTSLKDIKEGKFSYAKAQELDRKNFKDTFAINQAQEQRLQQAPAQKPFLRHTPNTIPPTSKAQRAPQGAERASGFKTIGTVMIGFILVTLFVFEDFMDEGLVFFLYAAIGILLLALLNSRKSSK